MLSIKSFINTNVHVHTHKHTQKADDTNVGQLGNNGKSNILWEVCKLIELLWKTIWHNLEKLIMYISQNPAIHSQIYNTSEKFLHNYTKRHIQKWQHYL